MISAILAVTALCVILWYRIESLNKKLKELSEENYMLAQDFSTFTDTYNKLTVAIEHNNNVLERRIKGSQESLKLAALAIEAVSLDTVSNNERLAAVEEFTGILERK